MDTELLESMTAAIVETVAPDEVVLFGSHAKGTAHSGSDIDLLIVVDDSPDIVRGRRRITARLYRRLVKFPVSKDILLYTRGEVERWKNVSGHIIETSLREGRVLYERG